MPATGDARCRFAEAEPVRAVERERDRASVAVLAEREERHRFARLRLATGVLPEHERTGARVADDVHARHRRQLVAEEGAERREDGRGASRWRRARDDVAEIERARLRFAR